MKLDVRYANHPEDSKRYTTEELRKHYFIGTIFEADEAAQYQRSQNQPLPECAVVCTAL